MRPRMADYVVVLALSAAITIGGIMLQNYLEQTAAELATGLQAVQTAVEQNNWAKSHDSFAAFSRKWHPIRRNWELFIDHFEIDSIEKQVYRIEELLKAQDRTGAIPEIGEAVMLVKHIPRRERLTLHNLF
ncbi:hypothetical protein SY88_10255 [Clostridiales bacterium PH28_bin88]|nr:hypothetical protein SY88_10255 [Clostridiales bacterium PH28_bin88]